AAQLLRLQRRPDTAATADLRRLPGHRRSDLPRRTRQAGGARQPSAHRLGRVASGSGTPAANPAWHRIRRFAECGRHWGMADLIPREGLFGNPDRIGPQIPPHGSQLAWIAPRDGVLNVWVAPVGAPGVDWDGAQAVTDDTDRGVRVFAWAWDGRHLLYLQDTGGDENWRLYDVDLTTMQRRDLTPFDGVPAQIIAMEKKFPTDILVALNPDNPQLHHRYPLHPVTRRPGKA